MEAKINLAAILKDKPKGTKLYSILSDGECFLNNVSENEIYIDIDNSERFWCFSANGSTYSFPNGCVLLFPSREMRDWRKFAWKKGDVLVSNDGKKEVFFNGFTDDSYALFKAKHGFEVLPDGNTMYLADEDGIATSDYTLEDKNDAQTYINTIEERLGGKLNRETLNVEKSLPEFKDGDIVVYKCEVDDVPSTIFIFRGINQFTPYYSYYASLDSDGFLSYKLGEFGIYNRELRLATEEEKTQLFSALAKKNKAWDAEKKMIVELKPKVELKPFDKVLVRDDEDHAWQVSLFGYKDATIYRCNNGCSWNQCIHYFGNENLLGTTKNVEG